MSTGARSFTEMRSNTWRRLSFRPIRSATCTVQTRKQVPRGAFFFMCQRGLQGPSALRRRPSRARSVSERPPSLSTRPALSARRVQNIHAFQGTGGIALRPCFAGSGLSQRGWRRNTGGVVFGMFWEFCAKSLVLKHIMAGAQERVRCSETPGKPTPCLRVCRSERC